jgi:mucin-2
MKVVALGSNIRVNDVSVIVSRTNSYVAAMGGVRIDKIAMYYTLTYGTMRVHWDDRNTWKISLDEPRRTRETSTYIGMCGNFDGDKFDDLMVGPNDDTVMDPTEFGNKYKITDPGSTCPDEYPDPHSCPDQDSQLEALRFCDQLIQEPFADCNPLVNVTDFHDQCVEDYCTVLQSSDRDELQSDFSQAICDNLEAYSEQCVLAGLTDFSWRTDTRCPRACPGNMVSTECVSTCAPTCDTLSTATNASVATAPCTTDPSDCLPGCQCPFGTVFDKSVGRFGRCVQAADCTCSYQGSIYFPGNEIEVDCNTCHCTEGRWDCTKETCPMTCSVVGMQHIETFDGNQYDFRGPPCTFTLVEPNNLVKSNPSFMDVGDVTISYEAHLCPGKTADVACAYAINVQQRRSNGNAVNVRAEVGTTPDGQITFI